MRRGGGGRRLPAAPDRTPMQDPHILYGRNLESAFSRRDSDAFSLCSSRPSSIGTAPSLAAPVTNFSDKASQAAALRVVNAYLAPTINLRHPFPAAKDILAAFRHFLDVLQYRNQGAFEDDLLYILRFLGCPYKLTRSALKAPGTPHSWPPLLSVLYWLTLLVRCDENADNSTSQFDAISDDLTLYFTNSYSLFISGEDDAVAALDDEYFSKARVHAEADVEATQAMEKEAQDLEAKRIKLTSGPSTLEKLQTEKEAFTADIQKFESVVNTWTTKIQEKEESLACLDKELEAKVLDGQRIVAENEELMKKVDTQKLNVRDVERMQREIQAVEHDISKSDNGKVTLEEKGWDLDTAIVRKLEEIEGSMEQVNQALRKLNLNVEFHYTVNTKGSSPVEVLGTGYKTILKPALNSLADEMRMISVSKHDDVVDLEKQSQRNAKVLEEKRNCLSAHQANYDKSVALMDSLDVEIENHGSRCKNDARLIENELEKKEHELSTVEKEAHGLLKNSENRLQDAKQQSDQETQLCARQLLELIDSVADYKEFMEATISGMKKELYETVDYISSLPSKAVPTS
uniref:Kinetochore protein NDC80 n=1 Tax=Leersia perrieri TaxID=77586 RepID=A0A0D9X8R5_9ORYZ